MTASMPLRTDVALALLPADVPPRFPQLLIVGWTRSLRLWRLDARPAWRVGRGREVVVPAGRMWVKVVWRGMVLRVAPRRQSGDCDVRHSVVVFSV
jgi:hypothetical protein